MEEDWQNNIFKAEHRHGKLLEKGFLADVSFSVCMTDIDKEPKILAAHKLILASASSAFHAMFYGPLAHKTDAPIKVDDIDTETFSIMLKYIYSNQIDRECWRTLVLLYYAATKYLMKGLSNYCLNKLDQFLKVENALQIYGFAKFYGQSSLKEKAFQVIKKETLAVINSPDFLEIDEFTMLTILAEKELQATEMELYGALESAATAQNALDVKKQQENVSDEKPTRLKFRAAVKKINFLEMTVEEFSNGPAISNLLLPEESLAIIRCLVNRKQNIKFYPKGFAQGIRGKPLPRVFFDFTCNSPSNYNQPINGKFVIEVQKDFALTAFDKLFVSSGNSLFIEITGSSQIAIAPICLSANAKTFKINASKLAVFSSNSYGYGSSERECIYGVDYKDHTVIFIFGNKVVYGQVVEGKDVAKSLYDRHSGCARYFKIGGRDCKKVDFRID